MRRLLFLCIALTAPLVLTGCGPDGPTIDRDRFDAAKAAAKSMTERFDAADPTGEPPRISDPAVASDLAALYDLDYVASLETLPVEEGAVLGEWATSGTGTGLGYLLWGTGKTSPTEFINDDPALVQITENTIKYRDELGPYLDFSLHVTEAIARSLAAELTTRDFEKPKVKSGLQGVRSGFAGTISGVIDLFDTPGLPDDWLIARLPALQATKETASAFLATDTWRELTDYAREIAGRTSNPEITAGLKNFGK